MSLKYRTSAGTSASNFSDLVVKVGDTLPIGAIIEYDTSGTIPSGWEIYTSGKIKKISPTTPANGNIENQYGTSQTNAYSEEYSNTTFATKDVATTSANGLMSANDKSKLNNLLQGTLLYNNDTGSNETITLSDTTANYDIIEIYYKQNDNTCSFTKVYSPNGRIVSLVAYHVTNNGYAVASSFRNVRISGNTLCTAETDRTMFVNLVSNDSMVGGTAGQNNIYITQVIGYKQ